MAGLILILVLSGFVGLYKTFLLKKRCEDLNKTEKVLEKISLEMKYEKKPIKDIFNNLPENIKTPMTENLGSDVLSDYRKFKKNNNMLLIEEDYDVLDMFFEDLGKTDLENQITLCDITLKRINENSMQAKSIYNKYAKLYSAGGILVGLFIVILLI